MPNDDAKAQLSEVKRLRARGMVGCTLKLVRRYLSTHPKHGVVWLYYADALFELARYKEALAALRLATPLCPPDKLQLIYFCSVQIPGAAADCEKGYAEMEALSREMLDAVRFPARRIGIDERSPYYDGRSRLPLRG